jgi:hypothetical protein
MNRIWLYKRGVQLSVEELRLQVYNDCCKRASGSGQRSKFMPRYCQAFAPVLPVNNFQLTDDPIGNLLESRSTIRVGLPSSCNRVPSTAAFAGSRLYGWLVFSGGEREERRGTAITSTSVFLQPQQRIYSVPIQTTSQS